ncbi:MAG: SDR family oxidoreductase [Microthrixaceae bacterium]
MGRFEGKSVLVTGAASGMGRATTLAFAAEGANVLGVDLDAEGLAAMAAEAGDLSGRVLTHRATIGTQAAGQAAVAAAVEAFGGLDVLANVAGVVRSDKIADVTEDDWNLMFAVNVSGMFWLCQAALGAFGEDGGAIVNVASNAGLMGQAYFAGYCASKGAVVNLTRSLAMETAKNNKIHINALAPGQTATPMTGTIELPEDCDIDIMRPYMGYRKAAKPEEQAAAILFLASPDASAFHGAIVSSDGALTAG